MTDLGALLTLSVINDNQNLKSKMIPPESNEKMDPLNLKKLEVEINRIEAETSRIELEIEENAIRINTPWYKKTLFIQAVVAGLVAIPLIWFYVKEIALPIFQKENIELSLKNAETEKKLHESIEKLRQEKIIYNAKLKSLEDSSKESWNERLEELEQLKKDYQKLQAERKNLLADYKELKNLNDKLKFDEKFDELNRNIKKAYEEQKEIINNLQLKIRKTTELKALIDDVALTNIEPFKPIIAASGPGSDIIQSLLIEQLVKSNIEISSLRKYIITIRTDIAFSQNNYGIKSFRVNCSINMLTKEDSLFVPSVAQVKKGIIFGLDEDQALNGYSPNQFQRRIAEPIVNAFVNALLSSKIYNNANSADAKNRPAD